MIIGYAIARWWEDAQYGKALEYLGDNGQWVRGTRDARGEVTPPGARIFANEAIDAALAEVNNAPTVRGRSMRIAVVRDPVPKTADRKSPPNPYQ